MRQLLKRMCCGLMHRAASCSGSQVSRKPKHTSAGTAAARATSFCTPKAKRVVFLFLNGGHVSRGTFDPKPELAKREGAAAGRASFKRRTKGNGLCLAVRVSEKTGKANSDVCETCPRSIAGASTLTESAA